MFVVEDLFALQCLPSYRVFRTEIQTSVLLFIPAVASHAVGTGLFFVLSSRRFRLGAWSRSVAFGFGKVLSRRWKGRRQNRHGICREEHFTGAFA